MTKRGHTLPSVIAGFTAALLVVFALVSPRLAAAGWLIAFVFLSAIPLGSLAWLMLVRLTGGHWGVSLRPVFQAAAALIPPLAVAFAPVLIALPLLYPWVAGSDHVKADVATFYLNIPMFIMRTVVAFIGWSAVALLLPQSNGRAGVLFAAVGLVFYALMVSLLSVDWILSTQPAFISTSFGATTAITQMLAALAFAALRASGLDDDAVSDLGALMLAATLGVTYLNFMAALVFWYGNLPDQISWFAERVREPWLALAVASFVLGSVVPGSLLLLGRVRSNRKALRYIATSIIAGIALYDAWLLAPAYGIESLASATLSATALACTFLALSHARRPTILFGCGRIPP